MFTVVLCKVIDRKNISKTSWEIKAAYILKIERRNSKVRSGYILGVSRALDTPKSK